MGDKTKIDWADASWNPVTGCYHGCDYCYARGIATRFSGFLPEENPNTWGFERGGTLVTLDSMQAKMRKDGKIVPAPYPFGFTPTLHKYKLDEPARWTKPRNIFVCSMADLFGKWVPDEWISEVINACLKAPQHRYLFLTKNPARYISLITDWILPDNQKNFWLGSTATTPRTEFFWHDTANTFVSVEPILAPFTNLVDDGVAPATKCDWIIIGAETGRRKDKVVPKKEWISELVAAAEKTNTPVFMKESLRPIMGKDFIQQFPWERFDMVLFPADENTLDYADNPTV